MVEKKKKLKNNYIKRNFGWKQLFRGILAYIGIFNYDAPEKNDYWFQDIGGSNFFGIDYVHANVYFFLILISIFVGWMVLYILSTYKFKYTYLNLPPRLWFFEQHFFLSKNTWISRKIHDTTLEVIWTLIPCFFLICIATPSIGLIYAADDVVFPQMTIKVIGHQWYWTYDYNIKWAGLDSKPIVDDKNVANIENKYKIIKWDWLKSRGDLDIKKKKHFDSRILNDSDLLASVAPLRLLEVDQRLYLPIEMDIRCLITSADVIHSWAIPSLGVKMDAIPGRLNQINLIMTRVGSYYGQCMEICGQNHAYMPIHILGVDSKFFFFNSYV